MYRFTLLIAVLISQVCYTTTDQIRRHELKNHSLLGKSNSDMYRTDNEYSRNSGNKFIDTLKGVLIRTLKSLNRYNNDLAIYFVQHHPFLAKTFNQLSNPYKTYPSKKQKEEVSSKNIGSLQKMSIRLSEFQRIPPKNKKTMLSAGFKSNNVKATEIVADDVIVKQNVHRSTALYGENDNSHKSNKKSPQQASFSFHKKGPGSQFKFSSWRSGNSRQTISTNADQQFIDSYRLRRHYFPSRQIEPTALSRQKQTVSKSKSHMLAPIEKSYSKHKFKYPASARSIETKPYFSKPNKIEQKHIPSNKKELEELWDDSWSDSDSEYEYYDDDDNIDNRKPVIRRSDIDTDEIQTGSDIDAGEIQAGSDINAGEIQAGSMYADVIKANQMNAQRIVADDVVVSAKYRDL
uniref:SKD-rich protein-1 n=1 Tax=Mytilus coruscus TaxID=42192 RepID=A0A0K0YB19_MYTCO|nr:SKD-rich protein-1 [Mytilus coruscus]